MDLSIRQVQINTAVKDDNIDRRNDDYDNDDNDNDDHDDERTILRMCDEARRIWLHLKYCDTRFQQVQEIYTKAWNHLRNNNKNNNKNKYIEQKNSSNNGKDENDDDNISRKRTKINTACDVDVNSNNRNTLKSKVGEKLALLLLQTGQTNDADIILYELGYKCRLAASLFNYESIVDKSSSTKINVTNQTISNSKKSSSLSVSSFVTDSTPPCRIYQNLLLTDEIKMLRKVFLNPSNSYWTDHNYQVEPPSPYFSYVIPLRTDTNKNNQNNDSYGMIGTITHRIQKFLAKEWKNIVNDATYCEIWAHNRPHVTGHQFHFDSDNEGINTKIIRNPICSCVIYLTNDNTGGPSVITNQRLLSKIPADKSWLCYPNMNPQQQQQRSNTNVNNNDSTTNVSCPPDDTVNVCVFDGTILHGVMPGKPLIDSKDGNNLKTVYDETSSKDKEEKVCESTGVYSKDITPDDDSSNRRVTVMFAFWRRIRIRDVNDDGNIFGAARLLPNEPDWAKQLCRSTSCSVVGKERKEEDEIETINDTAVVNTIEPIQHNCVYETIGTSSYISGSIPWTRKMGMIKYHEIFQGF